MFIEDILVVIFLLQVNFAKFSNSHQKTFEEWFDLGKSAYLENNWKKCTHNFENALESYHKYVNVTLFCRHRCKNITPIQTILTENTDSELVFYEQKIHITLCLLQCKKSHTDYIDENDFVKKEIILEFENYEPYNYLQLCYYQLKNYQEALKSSFTYYVHHLEDEVAKTNLKYYMQLTQEKVDDIVNREAHVSVFAFFIQGFPDGWNGFLYKIINL